MAYLLHAAPLPVPMTAPLILWFRRDLRLDDHPMLAAAVRTGRPLLPVFILDPETETIGAAACWRLGLAVAAFAQTLARRGSRLTLRRGPALAAIEALLAETGAAGVYWSRGYDPAARARDGGVKAALKARGIEAASHAGALLHEPWTVETGQGGPYRVYTPFWRAVRDRDVAIPDPAPARLPAPDRWPASDRLDDWRMGAAMNRGADVLRPVQTVGEDAALARLEAFIAGPVDRYAEARDFPARDGTSRLSAHLTTGEIGPRRVWHAGLAALQAGRRGAETFLKELVWRDFAWHLMYHTPHIATANWKPDWDAFPWRDDNPEALAWRQGRTGVPLVDAAMREMYVTGTMHNRGRMIVASYLTKHLLTHWRVGLDWFADCLTDWDPASNAMGWQWAAGSGPDAAPYFRIFNPDAQGQRFDPDGSYRRRWIAERSPRPGPEALAFFDAVPRSWALDPGAPYPQPAWPLAEGRARALAAYGARNA
jgi:deoxyribodipyrimidine photo-lyase